MAPLSDPDTTTVDFYALLSIPPSANESEIRRAYRKTSRLYHPDKVTPTPETLEKFQQLQRAIDILTDATERAKYDSQREAKLRRAAETAALDSRRRKMKEDLESRERNGGVGVVNGVKRTWTDRELEIKRIAEENRRRMEEVKMKRMQELRKAEEDAAAAAAAAADVNGINGQGGAGAGAAEAIERSIKVRWVKEGDGLDIDSEALTEMFPMGEVEDVVILKDKKRKVEGKGKVMLGTAVLVFKSLAAAKRAIAMGKTDELESISWAMDGKDKETEPT